MSARRMEHSSYGRLAGERATPSPAVSGEHVQSMKKVLGDIVEMVTVSSRLADSRSFDMGVRLFREHRWRSTRSGGVCVWCAGPVDVRRVRGQQLNESNSKEFKLLIVESSELGAGDVQKTLEEGQVARTIYPPATEADDECVEI